MYYFASSMADPDKIEQGKSFYMLRNEKIVKKLEKSGIKIYLPQRDTDQSQTPRKIFNTNLNAIKKSKAIVLVLSDTRGIYLEAGYAKALGKKVIGLNVDETRKVGVVVRNFLDHIANSTDELQILLNGKHSTERK